MEFDPRSTDRLPFHEPDEAEQAHAGTTEPSRDAQRRHLQRVPLFSGFNEDELRRVAEISRIVEAPMGTVITQIGEPGDSFFVIIDGMAAVRTPVGAGSQLQPGDFFGEMSLIDSRPRSAAAMATSDCKLAAIGEKRFLRLVEQTPKFALQIMRVITERLRRNSSH